MRTCKEDNHDDHRSHGIRCSGSRQLLNEVVDVEAPIDPFNPR